ncbi:MAG: hypothetical protein R3A80_11845 [Bdellovibrionota bacterium]
MALPFLKAAEKGPEALNELYNELCEALRVSLFCTNCSTPLELKNRETL